jgi:hypothetical protein
VKPERERRRRPGGGGARPQPACRRGSAAESDRKVDGLDLRTSPKNDFDEINAETDRCLAVAIVFVVVSVGALAGGRRALRASPASLALVDDQAALRSPGEGRCPDRTRAARRAPAQRPRRDGVTSP